MTASTSTSTTSGAASARGGKRRTAALAALGLLAAVAILAGAWYVRDRSARSALASVARAAVAERRFAEARPLVDAWIAARPGDAEAYYLRARIEVAEEHPEAALTALRMALNHGYDPNVLNIHRAVLMARAGEHGPAEPVLRRALDASRDPEPELAEALARIYLSSFRLGPASAMLDRWMKDAPEDPRPYIWRNEIDERIEADPEVIIRNFRMALQRDPNLDKARLGLADKLKTLKRTAEAEAEYAAYLKRNPKSVDGHVGAGQTALDKGDIASAVRYFDDALALDPREPVALREMALIDLRNGQYARARDRLATVVEVDPYDPGIRASYSQALKMAGDETAARRQTEEVERLRKEHQRMNEIRVALVERPDDLKLRSEAARWLLEHGHDQEGLEWTKLILSKNPGDPETCAALVAYYKRIGNTGLANYYKAAAAQSANASGR